MKDIFFIYDTTLSLMLLTGPVVATGITLLYSILLTNTRKELAVVAGSMITATVLARKNNFNLIIFIGQLSIMAVYHYNAVVALIIQIIFDSFAFKSNIYQTKVFVKLCMYVAMLFTERHVAVCLFISLLHAIQYWLRHVFFKRRMIQ